MNKTHNLMTCLGLCALLFLSACGKDEPIVTGPDFSINNDRFFEVLETYPNGWIKEAVHYDYNGNPRRSYGYHANGYLSHYELYESYPTYHLAFEHQRDDQNLPVSSKYYDFTGALYTELSYEAGLPKTKTLWHAGISTIYEYVSGQLQAIEKRSGAGETLTTLQIDENANEHEIDLLLANGSTYNERFTPYTDAGAGYSGTYDIPLKTLPGLDLSTNRLPLNQAFNTSVLSSNRLDIPELMGVPIAYDLMDDDFIDRFGTVIDAHEAKAFALDDLYRSLKEQYSFAEEKVFYTDYTAHIDRYTLSSLSSVRTQAAAVRDENPALFESLYGERYLFQYIKGKNMYIVVTVRNLPSDEALREQLLDIAELQAEEILSGSELTSSDEEELLSNVFFEIRAHSVLLTSATQGVVINDYEDYLSLVEMVNAAEPVIFKREYRKYFD